MELKKPECYHAVIQWSADACRTCEYDMDCYKHFLTYMRRSKNEMESKKSEKI